MYAISHAHLPREDAMTALETPFAWKGSGLEPLPWFPFTVAASRAQTATAARAARRTEHAYWFLRRLFGFTPRFRLLVLDATDWMHFGDGPPYGVAHYAPAGHLVVGCEPAAAWHDVSRFLAARLPAAALRSLVGVHGRDPVYPDGPDLAGVAEALIAHELAHVIALQAGAVFPHRWLAEAFANYAMVAVLGETDPASLHRLGTLADATAALADETPDVTALGRDAVPLTPAAAVLVQLALTRDVYAAYAQARTEPLARWFGQARATGGGRLGPDADAQPGRHLVRDVHPALAPLADRAGTWQQAVARAA